MRGNYPNQGCVHFVEHVVRRTCIGCRIVDEPDHLLRLTLSAVETEPVVVVDEDRVLGGRGAWVHPDERCVQTAVKRGAFNRAFRRRVDATAAVHQIERVTRTAGTAQE